MSAKRGYLRLLSIALYDQPGRVQQLLAQFETEDAFRGGYELALAPRSRTQTSLVSVVRARISAHNDDAFQSQLDRQNIGILYPDDPHFPPLLPHIADGPAVLYYQGDPSHLTRASLAVVGSRALSPYGQKVTEWLVEDLCQEFLIVSGLAKGIDTVAHRVTLAHNQPTVAVIATGHDRVYPAENRALCGAIASNGIVLSEFPTGSISQAFHFPQRNRIVSGISKAVLVCEAGERSGSLVTARCAMEQGRDVFAVPGQIDNPNAAGCHALIASGATLVTNAADVLNQYTGIFHSIPTQNPLAPPIFTLPTTSPSPTRSIPDTATETERVILAAMSEGPAFLDDLIEQTGFEIQTVFPALAKMEIKQWVTSLSGNRYSRR